MRLLLFSLLIHTLTPCLSQSIEIKQSNSIVHEELKYINPESDTTEHIEKVMKSSNTESSHTTNKKEATKQKNSIDSDKEMLEQTAFIHTSSKTFYTLKQQISTQRTQRSPDDYHQLQMDQLVTLFSLKAPNSFEFYFFKYLAGNYNVALIDKLYKAESIKPDNQEIQKQLALCAIILNDKQQALSYLDKLISSGMLHTNLLMYAEDLLLSVPVNGTLITHGIEDTYAVVYLQWKRQFRSDVQLVSLELTQSESYRSSLKQHGYTLPESHCINIAYLNSFCVLNESKAISISMTVPKEYVSPIYQKCTVSGLVFEYGKSKLDEGESRNAALWFNKMNKKVPLEQLDDYHHKELASNYLPMLINLFNSYKQHGDTSKQLVIEKALKTLAIQTNTFPQIHKLTGIN